MTSGGDFLTHTVHCSISVTCDNGLDILCNRLVSRALVTA